MGALSQEVEQLAYDIAAHEIAATHEARHCAAALCLGLTVTRCEAPFRSFNSQATAGMTHVKTIYNDVDSRWAMAAAILSAVYDGERQGRNIGEFADREWMIKGPPFTLAPLPGDEAALLDLVGHFNQNQWRALISDVHLLTSQARYKRLVVALTHALVTRDRLHAYELLEIKQICDNAPWETIARQARRDMLSVLDGASADHQDERAAEYAREFRPLTRAHFPC